MSKPLTVGALRRILAKEDDRKLVVIAGKDICQSGYTYAAVHSVSASQCFDPKRREVGLSELTPQAIKLGYTDADVVARGKPAVILFP